MDAPVNPFLNRRVAFAGKLGGLTLREAAALVRQLGGIQVARDDARVDLIVVGAEQAPDEVPLPAGAEVLGETELWRQLGLVDDARLYTPAMLAQLLAVPIAAIRRWHRRGLILAQQTVHRLPYFAFAEIAVVKRLAELTRNGTAAHQIETQSRELARRWPASQHALSELDVIVEGRRLLVRQGDTILEPHGQTRFPFDSQDAEAEPATIALRSGQSSASSPSVEQLLAWADEYEEAGDLAATADAYRSALAAGGPTAQLCFQLAECLYAGGDLSAARERYAMAIELDDDFVEARGNLGCVLEELGLAELAIAAFSGALVLHPGYADAHLHLVRLLSATGRISEARQHHRQYEELVPASPWMATAE